MGQDFQRKTLSGCVKKSEDIQHIKTSEPKFIVALGGYVQVWLDNYPIEEFETVGLFRPSIQNDMSSVLKQSRPMLEGSQHRSPQSYSEADGGRS